MFVQLNSIKMYYKRYGSGRPLILLHGNGEDHTIFREVIKPLSKNFTLYLPDARGHGRSSGTEEFHYMDMASDMVQFIKKLRIESPAFYGFSDGGIVGLLLASKRPGLLSHLIISGANINPEGLKAELRIPLKISYFLVPGPEGEVNAHRTPYFQKPAKGHKDKDPGPCRKQGSGQREPDERDRQADSKSQAQDLKGGEP